MSKERESHMKSFKWVQMNIKRLCKEFFYYDMPDSEYISKIVCVENWIRCENTIGRIDDNYIYKSLDYARTVSRNIVSGMKGDDHNAN